MNTDMNTETDAQTYTQMHKKAQVVNVLKTFLASLPPVQSDDADDSMKSDDADDSMKSDDSVNYNWLRLEKRFLKRCAESTLSNR